MAGTSAFSTIVSVNDVPLNDYYSLYSKDYFRINTMCAHIPRTENDATRLSNAFGLCNSRDFIVCVLIVSVDYSVNMYCGWAVFVSVDIESQRLNNAEMGVSP